MPAPFTTVFLALALVCAMLSVPIGAAILGTLAFCFEAYVFYVVGAAAETEAL